MYGGQWHLQYIKQNRKVLYLNLLTSGKLNGYLADIDKQAEDMFSRLIRQSAERECVTEQLKADNQMEWVGRMNNQVTSVETFCCHFLYNRKTPLQIVVNLL